MSPSITGDAGPNSRSQPREGSTVSSMPPVPRISTEARPDTVSSAVSKPRTELAFVSWIAITTPMPSAMPAMVVTSARALVRHAAHDELAEEAQVHTPTSSFPSRMRSVREAAAATSVAWVASRIVMPRSRFKSASKASTVAPFSESKLPVGSSATSKAG